VNPRELIDRVKAKIKDLEAGLPLGVKIVPFYDRSELIDNTIDTLRRALIEEILLVTLAHIIFLAHFRSILIVTLPLPLAVLSSFLILYYLNVTSNIMSLAGIAIAIGVLVDAGIVVTENAFRHIEQAGVDPARPARGVANGAGVDQTSGPPYLLFDGHYSAGVHTRVRSHRPGGQTISTAGLRQDSGDGVCNGDLRIISPGALHAIAAGQGPSRARQPGDAGSAMDLPAGIAMGIAASGDYAGDCIGPIFRSRVSQHANRQRVHAALE